MSFLYNDFSKSGISENTTYEYIRQGYLTEDEDGWKLYYPGLYEDKKISYYNKRLKNPANSKYLKPKGETSKLFRPIGMSLKSTQYIIITEGEKKAIKAVQEGFYCLSLPGVWCWKQKTDDSANDNISADIIPDITNLDLNQKTVYLCYDNDMWEKEEVRRALYHFALYLIKEKNTIVKIILLPKEKEKLGLDDYLIKYGKEKFQKLLNNARKITVTDIRNQLSGFNNNKRNFPYYLSGQNQRMLPDYFSPVF